MDIFIKGLGNISPQNTINNTLADADIMQYESAFLKCMEPDYKTYINPVSLRRMSKIIKMGVTASQICLKESAVSNPDAIITATGLGCIEDTENFLNAIMANDEKMLNPTPFIQSTHNTMGAQIALILKCNNYNATHVHRGHSFESALLDAMLLLKDQEAKNVLLGAADELTPNFYKITSRLNLWKKNAGNHLKLLENKTKGTIAGEGAAFFLLSSESGSPNYAKVEAVDVFNKPETRDFISTRINTFLQNQQLTTNAIDLVIYGNSGDSQTDVIFDDLRESVFKDAAAAYYKHLCGEYHTSSSFALWLASIIIKNQEIPGIVKLNDKTSGKINNVLIYNHYFNINHSLILLKRC